VRQGVDVPRRGGHQVIGRNRPQLGRQGGPAQVVELVGVDFEGETQVASGFRMRSDCARLKAPVSQKTSTKGSGSPCLHLPPVPNGGQHLTAQETGVAIRVGFVPGAMACAPRKVNASPADLFINKEQSLKHLQPAPVSRP
jgi:hypothetical protein